MPAYEDLCCCAGRAAFALGLRTQSPCESAADHIEACTGLRPEVAECDTAAAETILEQTCESLAESGGKSDGWWCRNFGIWCDPPPSPEPMGDVTRFPIVLTHGFNGSPENEWGFHPRLIADLRRDHNVYVARVRPFGSVEDRAKDLALEVDAAMAEFSADKVNIIAHSMGGLDSRYLISNLEGPDGNSYQEHVASLTTISSPHRGTRIADAVLGFTPDSIEGAVNKLAEALARDFTTDEFAEDSDLFAAMRDMTEAGADARNAVMPDAPGVYYQSWAGVSNVGGIPNFRDKPACTEDGGAWLLTASRDGMEARLIPMAAVVAGFKLRPNDGMATVESARWGNFRGCIAADHYDEVSQIDDLGPDPRSEFAPSRFYREMAFELAAMGY